MTAHDPKAFDPVEAARVIGEMTAYIRMMPAPLRPIGNAFIELCDAMLKARTRDAAEIGRLKAIIRVNGLRAGATDAEIDALIEGAK